MTTMAETNKNQGQGTQGNQGQQNFGTNKGAGTPGTQGQQFHGGTQTGQGAGGFGQGNEGQGKQQQGGTATGIAERVKEGASSATSAAKQAASEFLHSAAEQAEHATTGVASGMHSLAGNIRERAPSQGMLGTAAGNIADTLDSGGRYLEQEGLSGMAEDFVGLVRRNPMASMCVCLCVGFVLGRLLTSNNSRSL
jgi:hypothetical protein